MKAKNPHCVLIHLSGKTRVWSQLKTGSEKGIWPDSQRLSSFFSWSQPTRTATCSTRDSSFLQSISQFLQCWKMNWRMVFTPLGITASTTRNLVWSHFFLFIILQHSANHFKEEEPQCKSMGWFRDSRQWVIYAMISPTPENWLNLSVTILNLLYILENILSQNVHDS